jgi:transcriptional regulator GlxA family with amidase domain
MRYFLPMAHVVAFVAYPGFQLLDVAGPAAVFNEANHVVQQTGARPHYRVEVLSSSGGAVPSGSGIEIQTRAFGRVSPSAVDTLLISGAPKDSLLLAMRDPAVRRWVPRCAKHAARFGSVCSGTFVLASLGLLEGKRVATHWDACDPLANAFPHLDVDRDVLYVADGKVWTSAGVTTGIDMALAIVARDLGADVANAVAKQLVLYSRRPGYQSQFSPLLRAQLDDRDPFARLVAWIQANLDKSLDVPSLAAQVGLSERTFHRRFTAALGQPPARFIESVRLDAARTLLSGGRQLKAVAAEVGLPPARLRGAFERRFGVAPRLYREMHAEA